MLLFNLRVQLKFMLQLFMFTNKIKKIKHKKSAINHPSREKLKKEKKMNRKLL